MKLNHKIYGEGQPLIIMHGVFGSGDNWTTLARQFGEQYKTIVPDLRNHGRSPQSDEFSYEAMVGDIHELAQDLGLDPFYLVGHSMGGKVAMFFAEKYPDLLKKLVVVDIAPRFYQPHHQQILAGFRSVPLATLTSRQDAENAMMQHIDDAGVRQFLLKNLYRTDEGGFAWRVNLDVIEAGIEEVGKAFEPANPVKVPTLFIRGGNSKYIQERDETDIERLFESAEIQTIENAGHWVHAEQPLAVFQAIVSFLNR